MGPHVTREGAGPGASFSVKSSGFVVASSWARLGLFHRWRGWPDLVRSKSNLVWGRGFWGKRKENEREKREKGKEGHGFFGFSNPILYFLSIFRNKLHFCVFQIIFSIFNKYDAKLNFRAAILN